MCVIFESTKVVESINVNSRLEFAPPELIRVLLESAKMVLLKTP